MTPIARARRVESVWISDLHLGSRACRAAELLSFLGSLDTPALYLVGDVVDGWALRHGGAWSPEHDAVVREVLSMARRGVRVVYVPGNHDAFARAFAGQSAGGVAVAAEAVHVTADGRRLLVVHGDRFDPLVARSRWLAPVADGAMLLLRLLRVPSTWRVVRGVLGRPYRSLAQALAARANSAVTGLTRFRGAVVAEARRRGFDGVVCGHTHVPALEHDRDVLYANDGDWVRSMTALVERPSGRLALLRWRPSPGRPGATPGRHPLPRRRPARRPRGTALAHGSA